MRGKNIGKGVSILFKFNRQVAEAFDDNSAFGDSDCSRLIAKAAMRKMRKIKKHIKSVTGLKFNLFLKEVEKRTSAKWAYERGCYPMV